MKRGEVWWVEMPPPAGRRPAVLLSRDSAYRVRAAVTVAPVTRTIRDIPVEVLLDRSDGMPARCVVNLDDITTVPKSLIKERVTVLSAEKIQKIDEAIRFALDIS
ncbi:MAG: type II toxin-antitoxin system PemK/MazF family toxin [Deltaproteobacteria bacterium]|nr:type II toxin-antitoxin system PemK/MazF family toxin [Deltaproteobacteria bacterium]MBI2347615.1 type II toxin-antitoxin system PemK/MazF family toxin [Deltaproteobacteria bacterium]MBI2990583.1 type II toxin-antitoxin system PemK/MazF family toxin [Deltaproteobacteria bacterium]